MPHEALSSGLAENVPRDAFVQEVAGSGEQFVGTLPGALSGVHVIGASLTSGYLNPNAFLIGGNGVVSEDALQMLEFAWRMPDGELKAVTSGQSITTNYYNCLLSFSDGRYTPFGTSWEAWIASSDGYPACPAYITPREATDVSISQQPAFDQVLRADSKINYPTGGTGTDNANARDGNENTAASIAEGGFITLTFNDAPAPFANDDTTASTLHVKTTGSINFEDSLGSTSFGSTTGSPGEYRFTQASPRDFNKTVRCEGWTGGGTVIVVWWEHDLYTTSGATRTADVELENGTTREREGGEIPDPR